MPPAADVAMVLATTAEALCPSPVALVLNGGPAALTFHAAFFAEACAEMPASPRVRCAIHQVAM